MEGFIYSDNKKAKSFKGKSLFDFADTLNIRVPTSCRRNGECHECIVQVSNGQDNLAIKDQSEEFLTNKGHNLKNCEWMTSNNNEIIEG